MPSAETVKSLEKLVCHVYSPKAEFDDIGKLRWQLFKQSQAEAEKMPPTKDVLKYHILRAHYQAMVWSQAAIPQPTLPQPTMFGWKTEGEVFVPIITAQKVAPDTVLELVSCGCGISRCKTNICSCRKQGLVCTEMCKCEGTDDKCCNNRVINLMGDDENDGDDDELSDSDSEWECPL